jgi:ribose transport system ATP-binding protein
MSDTRAESGNRAGAAAAPALRVRGLSKTFFRNRALVEVDLEIAAGEVHALCGENGSGKSTLIKILSGYHEPDSGGSVEVGGRKLNFGSPQSSHELGCRFVHQDLALVPELSVLDNLALGNGFPSKLGTISRREALREAAEDLDRLGLSIDPKAPVSSLAAAQRTGVAVARALRGSSGVRPHLLVLDEPTATLPVDEVEHLFTVVNSVAAEGVGILYVTHRLDEVFRLAERVSVLRDGKLVATTRSTQLDRPTLVTQLVGSELEEAHREALQVSHFDPKEPPILDVQGVSVGPLKDVSFRVRKGEILGIAGITGSGRESILGVVFGALSRDRGDVRVEDKALKPERPDLAIGAGVAYLPPDRKRLGGFMEMSGRENLTLVDLDQFWRFPWFSIRKERAESVHWYDFMDVRPKDATELQLTTLSGGNQQKVLFGKWMRARPKVFLMDEPTQGVDIGAKGQLHHHLINISAEGAAVVVASTDVDELASVCSRILVLADGKIVAELTGGEMNAVGLSRLLLEAPGDRDNKQTEDLGEVRN